LGYYLILVYFCANKYTKIKPMEKEWSIIWHDSLDSTNLEAQRLIDDGHDIDNLSVIATKIQTAGKGQGDHVWVVRPGENLTFTVILKYCTELPDIKAADQQLVSMITALSVVDYLKSKGIDANIKLPNDIYVGKLKICGILIRHKVKSEQLLSSILGVGINVNQTVFPEYLPNPVSIANITGKSDYDIEEELLVFLCKFTALLDMLANGRAAEIQERFQSLIIEIASSGR